MVGSIVFATEQGLGILAKDFYDNGVINKVYVQPHTRRKTNYEWYPDRYADVEQLLNEVSTLLFFETPFYPAILDKARKMKIKTVIMPMFECSSRLAVQQCDAIINPSLLDQHFYPDGQFIPVPVNETWRERRRARVFVHNAGNGGLMGRNGTEDLIEAFRLVKSPARLIIRTQEVKYKAKSPNVEVRYGTFGRNTLYREGDVFIFPEKFNGLSLPLQEAFASGMLVMAGDRFPMNTWLPTEPLIPVDHYEDEVVNVKFKVAHYKPQIIAQKIDEWYDREIRYYSHLGRQYGIENSWEKLKPKYLQVCNS